MVVPTRIWEYIASSLLIVLAPGPSVLFIIARAISWGRKTALFTVLGNAIGTLILSALVAVGLGPILQRSDIAYATVQWGGGAYLIYLGIDAIRHRHVHAANMAARGEIQPSPLTTMRQGLWVALLNPKILVFNAAVLPQFIDRGRGSVTAQLLLLGTIFAVMCLVCDGSWGLLAGTARDWLATDASRLVRLRTIGGIVMVLLGTLVIGAAIRHLVGA
ncbi:MAG: LysE family translocator [Actinomycetes bacterium]